MTFQADTAHSRVWDPERGLELFRIGSGPGAWNAFEIAGPSTSFEFLATQTVTKETKGPPGDYSGQPCWQIYFHVQFGPEKLKIIQPLVEEAMKAYKSVFGFGRPECIYSVEFVPWETDITN
jgi:hypothetical protein